MQFRNEYPEFKKVDDSTINHFLESSALVVSKKVWGKLYELGLFAYTAHRLAVKGVLNQDLDGNTIFNNGENFKSVSSKSAGGLSIGYTSQNTSSGNPSDYDLTSTSYGQEYLRLRRLITPIGIIG
ncbi:MAG: hypothetical protein [Caudoviricetes sp.]|nr:MAG: hypothetical protein [Caudoviricetes sp.]